MNVTKIGINVVCKTAKQQNELVKLRNAARYWEDSYRRSIGDGAEKIIKEFGATLVYMGASERYTRDGDVVNSILFEVESLGGIDKKKIKESISLLVDSEIKKEGAGELQLTDLS